MTWVHTKRSTLLTWLLPAVLGGVLYLVNLRGTWIYDDVYIAHEDPRVGDVHRWKEYLTQGYFPNGADELWRPLVSMTYAVEWALHGERAWPFHLVNLLLHAAVCAMVARLALRLTGNDFIAVSAGLLFAAHPIHVEAVSGIVGRAEELCAIGVLGALLLMLGRPLTPRQAAGIWGCFLLAVLSKEQGLLLPVLLAGCWLLRRSESPTASINPGEQKALRILIAILTLTTAGYITYRNSICPWFWEKQFLDATINPLARSHGVDRWLIPVALLGRYTALLIAPLKLSPDYGLNVLTTTQRLDDPYLWAGALVLVAVVIVAVLGLRKRWRAALFCLLGLGMTYFLAGNIVLIGTIFGERLMYLPSVFVCIIAAMLLSRLPLRAIAISAILILYCVRTETYAWQWNDRLRFYAYAYQTQPKSAQVTLLLADELAHRHGDRQAAKAVLAQGRANCPDAWKIWRYSAQMAMEDGDLNQAMAWARIAMKLHPSADCAVLISEIAEKFKP